MKKKYKLELIIIDNLHLKITPPRTPPNQTKKNKYTKISVAVVKYSTVQSYWLTVLHNIDL